MTAESKTLFDIEYKLYSKLSFCSEQRVITGIHSIHLKSYLISICIRSFINDK